MAGHRPGTCGERSFPRVATDGRGGIAERCGHWILDERPDWALVQRLDLFGEEPA